MGDVTNDECLRVKKEILGAMGEDELQKATMFSIALYFAVAVFYVILSVIFSKAVHNESFVSALFIICFVLFASKYVFKLRVVFELFVGVANFLDKKKPGEEELKLMMSAFNAFSEQRIKGYKDHVWGAGHKYFTIPAVFLLLFFRPENLDGITGDFVYLGVYTFTVFPVFWLCKESFFERYFTLCQLLIDISDRQSNLSITHP